MPIKTRSNDFGDFYWNYYKLGPIRWERDSVTLRITKKIYYNINISWPEYAYDNLVAGDGEWGPGKRLEFTIWPFGHWLIGLEKKNKFQKWTFKRGIRNTPPEYTRIKWSPPRSWRCETKTGETKNSICGAFRFHKCPYKEISI